MKPELVKNAYGIMLPTPRELRKNGVLLPLASSFPQSSPKLSRTILRQRFLNSLFSPLFSSLQSMAASTLAGLSSLGLFNSDKTLIRIVSGV